MPVPIARDDDGADGAARRIAAAKKHLNNFGLSTECGWGRMKADEAMPLLELHGMF